MFILPILSYLLTVGFIAGTWEWQKTEIKGKESRVNPRVSHYCGIFPFYWEFLNWQRQLPGIPFKRNGINNNQNPCSHGYLAKFWALSSFFSQESAVTTDRGNNIHSYTMDRLMKIKTNYLYFTYTIRKSKPEFYIIIKKQTLLSNIA